MPPLERIDLELFREEIQAGEWEGIPLWEGGVPREAVVATSLEVSKLPWRPFLTQTILGWIHGKQRSSEQHITEQRHSWFLPPLSGECKDENDCPLHPPRSCVLVKSLVPTAAPHVSSASRGRVAPCDMG